MDSSTSNSQIYRKTRNDLIEGGENPTLAAGTPQPPKLVGHDVTFGFGYDLTTRRSKPLEILADLAAAGFALTMPQKIAIIFYGVDQNARVASARAYALNYLDDLAAFGTTVTSEDRAFVGTLGTADRTNEGLLARLLALKLTITKPKGEALLNIIVEEKEKELDDFLRKSELPDTELDRFHKDSDQRAVLVDMYYQSRHLFGPALVEALKTHQDAAAALEIAFLSNKEPQATPGDDERDFERARIFLGGTLAPRNEAEARGFLRAMGARSDALSQALGKRRGDARLQQPYLNRFNEVVLASLDRLGIATKLTLQPDGSWMVGSDVPLDDLARAFGLSPRELALANPDIFPTPPDGPAMFPEGKTLHLPVRRAPPRRGHASLEGDELLARLSPAALAALDADAWRIGPELELAAARYGLSELTALPALNPGVDLPALAARLGFGGVAEPDWLPSLVLPEPPHTDGIAPDFPISPRHGVNQAVLARIAAAFERCERAVEQLDRQIDNWIERRNAARRPRDFD